MQSRSSLCKVRALAAIFLAITPVVPAYADEIGASSWPEFRGASATGLTAGDEEYPVEFGPDQKLQWRTAVSVGHSSPAVWGNAMFLTAFDEAAQELRVVCIGPRHWCRRVDEEGRS